MKFRTILLSLCVGLFVCVYAQQDGDTDAQRSFKNCVVRLRVCSEFALNGKRVSYNPAPYADTLYNYIYKGGAELTFGEKVFGNMALQPYFYLSDDSRLNYADLEQCLAATQDIPSFYTETYIFTSISMGYYFENIDTLKSIACFELAAKANNKVYNGERSKYSKMVNNGMCIGYKKVKRFDLAAICQERVNKYCIEDCEPDSVINENTLLLAELYNLAENYQKADSCYASVIDRCEASPSPDNAVYVEALINRAETLQALGRDDEALEQLEIALIVVSTDDEEYLNILFSITDYYKQFGLVDEVSDNVSKAIAYFEKHPDFEAHDLYNWIIYHKISGTEKQLNRMLKLLEDRMPSDDVCVLGGLAVIYEEQQKYDKLKGVMTQLNAIYPALSNEEISAYNGCLTSAYLTQNNYEKAIEILNIACASSEELLGASNAITVRQRVLLSSYYAIIGKYSTAEQILNFCDEHTKNLSLKYDIKKAKSFLYQQIGDYQKSSECVEQLLPLADNAADRYELISTLVGNLICEVDIRQNAGDETSSDDSNNNLKANLVSRAKELVAISESDLNGDYNYLISAQQMLATAYVLTGDTISMAQTADKCEKNIRKYVVDKSMRAALLESLSMFSFLNKDYEKARSLIDTSVLSRDNVAPFELSTTLDFLAEISLAEGSINEAQGYYTRMANLRKDELKKNMLTLTSASRMRYWRIYKQEMLNAPKFADVQGQQSPFADVIYDMALYTKGLLINSDNQFRNAVLDSGNAENIEQLNQLYKLRSMANQPSLADESESFDAEADKIEMDLLAKINNTGLQFDISWTDVRKALRDEDLAVELLKYSDVNKTPMYGAAIVRNNYEHPVFVVIGNGNEVEEKLDKITDGDNYTTDEVWNFLKPYSDGVKNVYFSASGEYHKIPVESMVADDAISFYRLSTTAELTKRSDSQEKNAQIYGGISYDTPIEDIVADAANYPQLRGIDQKETIYRGQQKLIPLPGTKIEAEQIYNFMQGKLTAEIREGSKATEGSVKSLDGKGVNVLHIGTHGFCKQNYSDYSNSTLSSEFSRETEDVLLTGSGLMFAGVDNLSKEKYLPDGVDDGVLTAQEISTLDFRGMSLVVLSACKTAQGSVTGDGVFGLQRGFKKAGAQSLLMSLWRIDDDATVALMNAFYEAWLNGMTKHDALEKAKQTVRSNPAWNKPKFWAPFVLLDAIN